MRTLTTLEPYINIVKHSVVNSLIFCVSLVIQPFPHLPLTPYIGCRVLSLYDTNSKQNKQTKEKLK